MNSGDDAGVLAGTEMEAQGKTQAADTPAETPVEPGPGNRDAEEPNAPQASHDPEPDPDSGDDGDAGGDILDSRGDESERPRAKGAPVWLATMVVLVAALIAGVVVAVNYLGQANSVNAANSGRQAALSTASTAVTDMITTDYQHPDQYVAKLKPLAAGQFLSTFVNAGKGLSEILQQGKVQTTGRVVEKGIQKYTGDTATVTVVAYETVKNTQTPNGSQRAYRMVLSMIKSGSQWLVSNVEFVQ